MVRFTGGLLLFSALSAAIPSRSKQHAQDQSQRVLGSVQHNTDSSSRKLRGKFLHITDIHPDPFYKTGTKANGNHPCHSGDGELTAGYYGTPLTICDTPFSLMNATFKWIDENIKDEIDFVIWTGDSARHDNDEHIPRTTKQVEGLNRLVVDKFVEVFAKKDSDGHHYNDFIVPIVPTFGNNDILPHNIFEPGPNRWTKSYLNIWKQFIPEVQQHSFAQGGWFYVEVIPNKLAVFSLNTLYFYHNNFAVDGCDLKSEPGYWHMEWLRVQLQFIRQRGMKAILTGHVPPARTNNKQSWDESCWQKYTLWLHQYRDIIVGSLYGHANMDYFMLQDVQELKYDLDLKGDNVDDGVVKNIDMPGTSDKKAHISSTAKFLNDLRAIWSDLPSPPEGMSYDDMSYNSNKKEKDAEKFLHTIGGPYAERYSTSFVSPSVVPNYFPSLRVMEYNISGLENEIPDITSEILPASTEVNSNDMGADDFVRDGVQDIKSRGNVYYNADSNHDHNNHEINTNEVHRNIRTSATTESKNPKKGKKGKKGKKKKKRPIKPDFPVPLPPSHLSPPGPAYSPQTFSLLGWTQYYANLTQIQEPIDSDIHRTRLQESTHNTSNDKDLHTTLDDDDHNKDMTSQTFNYEIEYTTSKDEIYKLPNLSVRSILRMAEKIGKNTLKSHDESNNNINNEDHDETDDTYNESLNNNNNNKVKENIEIDINKKKKKKKHKHKLKDNYLWHVFLKRVFVSARSDEDLEGEF